MTLMHGDIIPVQSFNLDRVEIGTSEEEELLMGTIVRSPVTIAIEALQIGFDKYASEDIGLLWEALNEIEHDFIKYEWTAAQLIDLWKEFQTVGLIPYQMEVFEMSEGEIASQPARPNYKPHLIRRVFSYLRKTLIHTIYEVFDDE